MAGMVLLLLLLLVALLKGSFKQKLYDFHISHPCRAVTFPVVPQSLLFFLRGNKLSERLPTSSPLAEGKEVWVV